jgi:hypothetical protein
MQSATTVRYAIILLFLLFCSNFLFAQDNSSSNSATDSSSKKDRSKSDTGINLMMIVAYHSGISRSYEFSIARGHSVSTGGYPGFFMQYGGGVEVFQYKKDIAFAPKIFYELDPFLPPMCLSRVNLLYVTDFKGRGSLKYRHEIGFSFEGGFNVNYGYTFNLTNKSFFRTTHSLNLQWNIFVGKRNWENIRE